MAGVYNVEELLTTESGRIGPDIHQRVLNTNPWIKLIAQDAWPDEMGAQVTVLTYERALPHDSSGNYTPQTWSQVVANVIDNDVGNCTPSATHVDFPQTKRTYSIYQSAIESPDICVNDLRFPVMRKQQLSNMFNVLTQQTAYIWSERNRDEYIRLAGTKLVLAPGATYNTGLSGGATLGALGYTTGSAAEGSAQAGWFATATSLATAGTVPQLSQLTEGVLKRLYMQLVRDGGGTNSLAMENARPVFGLICSSETSENLLTLSDSGNMRQDIRWSSKADDLLRPLGCERSYHGFVHLIDDFAPRWDYVSNAWVRRHPYKGVAATNGKYRMEIDPLYETAAFEDSVIFHQDVYKTLVPKSISTPGGDTSFDPMTYKGDWKWLNIKDRVNNPDGSIGFFRGVFQTASEPILPQYGIVVRHLRCGGVPVTALTC